VNVAMLDERLHAFHVARRVLEQYLLLSVAHVAEQLAGLLEVIVIILTEVPDAGIARQLQRRILELRLLLPSAIAVRMVVCASAIVAVNPHRAVTMEAVDWTSRLVHRNLVMIHAQTVARSVAVREQSSLQHLVRREADAWHHIR